MQFRTVFLATLPLFGACATDIHGTFSGRESAAQACFASASKRQGGRVAGRQCDAALASSALSPTLRAATLVNRGIIAMDGGRIVVAVADFDAAIALMPANADAHINKGVALLRLQGHAAEAVAVLTTALDLEPRHPELAYYHRAIANEVLGRVRAAYEDYAVAAQLAPDWPEPAQQLQRFKIVRRKTLAG